MRKTIRKAYARAGLPHTRSHLLRHTMVSRLLAGGSLLKEVTDVLRHRSLNTTQIEFLRSHQCDEFQGFYFSKAVPAAAIADLLNARPWANPDDKAVVWGVEGVFPDSALMPLA